MPEAPVLALDGVTKRYLRGGDVLRGIDLELAPGSFCEIHGNNGGGKSTLLRIAARVTHPTSGRVRGSARCIRYAPERGALGDGLAVGDYLHAMGRLAGLPRTDVDDRTTYLLDSLGVQAPRQAAMRTLSKGTLKKIGIAQALLGPVDLLVLDEPTDGLDIAAVAALRRLLGERLAEGAAVIAASHNADLTDLGRSVRLHDGLLGEDDRPPQALVLVRLHIDAATAAELVPPPRAHEGEDAEYELLPAHVDSFLLDALELGAHVVSVEPW